ncbi:hypothetical protein [Bosea vaviloviae]|uniref:Secreted protein n=1 Tax=Bosea vaviloviae TaxID=1526658 RepID=A0A1D7U4D6_9HYPH|nr:hypothetical protein [Bosea vaviloviae]AOO82237.1 hypothetical protein BHK69_18910 [Bosea vaviloviae]
MIDTRLLGGRDRRRPAVKLAACILAGAASFAFAAQAKANDGNFQSVLVEAGCPTATIDKLSDRDGTATYRANCFSTSHKVIIVTCVRGVCAARNKFDHGDRG